MNMKMVAGVIAISLLAVTAPAFAEETEKNLFGSVKSVEGSKITIAGEKIGTRTIVVTPKTKLFEGDKKIETKDIAKGSLVYIMGSGKVGGDFTADQLFLERRAGSKTSTWNFVGSVQSNENGTITTTGKALGKRTIIVNDQTQVMHKGKKIEARDIPKDSLIRVVGTWQGSPDKITAQKISVLRKAV